MFFLLGVSIFQWSDTSVTPKSIILNTHNGFGNHSLCSSAARTNISEIHLSEVSRLKVKNSNYPATCKIIEDLAAAAAAGGCGCCGYWQY